VFMFSSAFLVRSSMFESGRVAEPGTLEHRTRTEPEHEPRTENPEV